MSKILEDDTDFEGRLRGTTWDTSRTGYLDGSTLPARSRGILAGEDRAFQEGSVIGGCGIGEPLDRSGGFPYTDLARIVAAQKKRWAAFYAKKAKASKA